MKTLRSVDFEGIFLSPNVLGLVLIQYALQYLWTAFICLVASVCVCYKAQ